MSSEVPENTTGNSSLKSTWESELNDAEKSSADDIVGASSPSFAEDKCYLDFSVCMNL